MTATPFAADATVSTVPYATPVQVPSPRSRAWAGAAIVFGGLGLVLLGGCFLIGVLSIVSRATFAAQTASATLTGPETGLMVVLYVLAFASFVGAAVMLFVGTRGLLRVLYG